MSELPPVVRIRRALVYIHAAMNRAFEFDRGRKADLSMPSAWMLYFIYFYFTKMGDIARINGISRATATDLVDHLERTGYVTRERGTNDKREIFINPTAQTEAWLVGREAKIFSWIHDGMARLRPDERETFCNLLSRFCGYDRDEMFQVDMEHLMGISDITVMKEREGNGKRLFELVEAEMGQKEVKEVKEEW